MRFGRDDVLTSCLTVGRPGSGKSWGTAAKLLWAAVNREAAIVVMDRHGKTTRDLLLLLREHGVKSRVLYDQFSNYERVLGGLSLKPSAATGYRKEAENDLRIKAAMDALWRSAGRKDADSIHSLPMISMYVDLGIRLLMFRDKPLPLSRLPVVYQLASPECRQIVATCADPVARAEWQNLLDLSKRVPKLVDDKISGALRLARQSFTPALLVRCEGEFDREKALEAKSIILLDGSNDGSVSKESAVGIYGMWNIDLFQTLQQHHARTDRPLPTIVVWEEAAATDHIGPFEIDMMREGRKFGLYGWVVTQDLGFATPEVKQAVKSCTVRHEWYNPGDADLARDDAAPDVAYAKLDPHRVLRVREVEKQRHGGFKPVTKVSTTKGDKGESTTQSQGQEAIYETYVERQEDLMTLDDQIKLDAQALLTMGTGYLMFRQGPVVTPEPVYVEVPDEPYPESEYPAHGGEPSLATKIFRRAVAESQQSACFRTVVHSEPTPWTPPSPPATKKGGNASRVRGRKPGASSSTGSTGRTGR